MANKDDDQEIEIDDDELNSSDVEEIPNKPNIPKKKKKASSQKNKGLKKAKKTYDGNGTDKSALKNQHEGGIETKIMKKPPKAKSGKFTFYFTGGEKKHLLQGIEVSLDTKMTPEKAKKHLEEQIIKNKIDMKGKQLIVYLPGGLPFVSGTLDIIYQNKDFAFNKVIYGIITRNVSDDVLNTSYPELCNVNGPERQLLISPLCDSSQLGLSDMACLLGYLNHDGAKSDLLLRTCATVINFPPLLTSMSKIINRNGVDGRTVITVTSTLYTFFRSYVPSTTVNEKVFEYSLRLCNLISHINQPPENIPMQTIEVKDDPQTEFLSDLNLGPIVYLWKGDTGEDFDRYHFILIGEQAIYNAYNIIASFRPIAPLSMRLVSGCSIVKGKDHEFLYIMQSASKRASDQNKVDIINPLLGLTISVDVEEFASEQENDQIDNVEDLIDPDNVQQIIMVNFDESYSMRRSLDGDDIEGGDEFSRFSVAYQYLTTFVNRTYGYRIQCIQGLISFADDIKDRCSLSPLCPDFEDKGLKNLEPNGNTKLWDSLDIACDRIIEFSTDERGNNRFKNAVLRILVISDGEDTASVKKPVDIIPKLIKNKITVDCVFASTRDFCKELAAVCHMTAGLAFRPNTVNEGLSLFELGAFLNIKERAPNNNPVIPGDRRTTHRRLAGDLSIITEEFVKRAIESATFDNLEVPDINIIMANSRENLATPAHHCSANRNTNDPKPRNRRILRELHLAAKVNDNRPDNSMYDPDLKIFTYKSRLDRWKAFIKGPEGTPYEKKWWHLLVTFPETYPVDPPVIRFVSIPYNLNVSKEGRICLNCLEKGYMSTKHVVDILQEIKEVFLLPHPESAIQLEKLDLFNNNLDEYKRLARESTDEVAEDDYEDFIDVNIDDDVDDDFSLKLDMNHIPPYMLSQISGNVIGNPVLSSTNVWYDRAELRQLVASNQNPICVITGKKLTETLDAI